MNVRARPYGSIALAAVVAVFGAIDACTGRVAPGAPGEITTEGGDEGGDLSEAAADHADGTTGFSTGDAFEAAWQNADASEGGSQDGDAAEAAGRDGNTPEAAGQDENAPEAGSLDANADVDPNAGCFRGDHGMPGCAWWAVIPGWGSGPTCCGGTCVDTTSDPKNCGACGKVCAAGCVGSLCM
jgi:hypothetical protein